MKSISEELLIGPVVSNEEIQKVIKFLSHEIYLDCGPKHIVPVLLCIDNGARFFLKDLKKCLDEIGFEYEEAHLGVKSYQQDRSTEVVKIGDYTGPSLCKRYVLIIEDIIDTARSMKEVTVYLDEVGVAHQAIYTLLFKKRPSNFIWRLFGLRSMFGFPRVKYVGMFIKNLFVVGCGLDYEGYGRSLKSVWVLSKEAKDWIDNQLVEEG
jgi:hypoxanthine phosphoribosyltransferase